MNSPDFTLLLLRFLIIIYCEPTCNNIMKKYCRLDFSSYKIYILVFLILIMENISDGISN